MRFLFLIGGLFFVCGVSAQDSTAVLTRLQGYFSPFTTYVKGAEYNPALQFYRAGYSQTELSLNGRFQKEERPLLAEEGDELSEFGFQARTWLKLGEKSRVWGEASYGNGRRENVRWNETSDIRLVYPYVMADSIGGGLKSETYLFTGGYAHECRRLVWGAAFGLRAVQEYRNKDPRPRNLVTDLNVSGGIGWRVAGTYVLAASARARKYKQTNEMEFSGTAGSSTVYHLTGMGMDYVRFRGNNLSTYYQGFGWGGSLDVSSTERKGVAASLRYERFGFEKIMSDLNKLPLAEVREQKLEGELAWTGKAPAYRWAVRVNGGGGRREGTENLFGDPVNNVYSKIGEADQYLSKMAGGTFSALYERTVRAGFVWSVLPQSGLRRVKMNYRSPGRMIEVSEWNAGMVLNGGYVWNEVLFWFSVGGTHHGNLKAAKSLGDLQPGALAIRALEDNYAAWSADRDRLSFTVRCDYAGWLKNKTVFAELGWKREWTAGGLQNNRADLSLGIVL